ncbi:hypothetical protein D3C75_1075640 [compost metagenome]
MGGRQLLQRPQGPFRTELLDKAQNAVHDNDGNNRNGVQIFAQHARNQCGAHQDQHHKILKLIQEQRDGRDGFPLCQLIRPFLFQTLCSFGRRQSLFRMGIQRLQHLLCRQLMPGFFAHGCNSSLSPIYGHPPFVPL